jgi:LPXTG-site transpeptidase (sortase) family protein
VVGSTATPKDPEIVEIPFSKTEENWDLTYLNQYAGHLTGTDLIGQGGNFVLAGHVEMKDGSRGPFADIHLLNLGDLITVMSNTATSPIVAQYKVTSVKSVDPYSLPEIQNHGFEELTLLTCGDWDNRNRVYRTRVVVHAKVVSLRHSLAFDASTRTFKIG